MGADFSILDSGPHDDSWHLEPDVHRDIVRLDDRFSRPLHRPLEGPQEPTGLPARHIVGGHGLLPRLLSDNVLDRGNIPVIYPLSVIRDFVPETSLMFSLRLACIETSSARRFGLEPCRGKAFLLTAKGSCIFPSHRRSKIRRGESM